MCSAFSPLVGSLAKRVTLKCKTNLRKTWLLSALAALWEVEGEGKRGGEEGGEGEGRWREGGEGGGKGEGRGERGDLEEGEDLEGERGGE